MSKRACGRSDGTHDPWCSEAPEFRAVAERLLSDFKMLMEDAENRDGCCGCTDCQEWTKALVEHAAKRRQRRKP